MSVQKRIFSNERAVFLAFLVGLFLAVTLSVFATSVGTNIQVTGDVGVNGGDLNIGTGSATTTLTSASGILGVASTTPWGLFSIESLQGTVLTGVPMFVIGDKGSTTPFFYVSEVNGNIGVGTSSPGSILSIQGVATLVARGTSTVYVPLEFPNFRATSTTATTSISSGGFTVGTSSQLKVEQFSGKVGVASTAPTFQLSTVGDALFAGPGTTTIGADRTTSYGAGCIQLRATDGTIIRIYASTTPSIGYGNGAAGTGYNNLVVEAGGCTPVRN